MKRQAEKGPHQPISGRRLHVPFEVFDHPAYRTASLRAKSILAAIQRQLNGWNNGKLAVSRDMIAERIGNGNHTANKAAIQELVDRGFLVREKVYPKCARLSTEYRLTYVSTGDHKNPILPTRDYEAWQGAGTASHRAQPKPKKHQNSRSTIEQVNPVSGSATEHEAKLSGSVAEPRKRPEGLFPGSITEQQLYYQGTGEPVRPDFIPEDRWLAAGRRAAVSPAAPPPEEIRPRAASHIAQHGHGSQGRLAAAAGIPKGTFSRFLRGDLDLSNAARVRLACALPSTRTAEERRQPPTALSGRPPANSPASGDSPPRAVDLRARLIRFLDKAPRGAQARLAELADLSSNDLSRFRQGAPFTDAKRLRLARALSDAETGALLNLPPSGQLYTPAARAAAS